MNPASPEEPRSDRGDAGPVIITREESFISGQTNCTGFIVTIYVTVGFDDHSKAIGI